MQGKNRISTVAKFIYLILVLFVAYLGFFYAYPSGYVAWKGISNFYAGCDFYKKEYYNTHDINVSFSKYYYHEAAGKLKIEKMNYSLVEDNVEIIKNNISISLNKLHELDNPITVEFDYDSITSDDYYSLNSNGESVLLHYYDVDENILYIISFPE